MKVVLAPEAQDDLADIWDYYAHERGIQDADNYLEFLKESISSLARLHARGKTMESRPELHTF